MLFNKCVILYIFFVSLPSCVNINKDIFYSWRRSDFSPVFQFTTKVLADLDTLFKKSGFCFLVLSLRLLKSLPHVLGDKWVKLQHELIYSLCNINDHIYYYLCNISAALPKLWLFSQTDIKWSLCYQKPLSLFAISSANSPPPTWKQPIWLQLIPVH